MVLEGIPFCVCDHGQQKLSQTTSGLYLEVSAVQGLFPLGCSLVGTLYKDKGAE